jgi:beta-glucosidase/6-phospho-beta-glucosidase/beta-galactosidase
MQGLVDERSRELMKLIEPKLERKDLEKVEKRTIAHISKMFYSLQRVADKEETNKRLQFIEESIQKIVDAKRVKASMKAALAIQNGGDSGEAERLKRKGAAGGLGGSQDMTRYFQTT